MRLIDVSALKEWVKNWLTVNRYYHPYSKRNDIPIEELYDILDRMPSAEPYNFDEWCENCKEYDHEKHCCPRFSRVIRTAMEEAKGEGNGV